MSDRGRIYDFVGSADLNVGLGFIETAITHQSIINGIIKPNQFLLVSDVEYDEEEKQFRFFCTIKEYLLN